MVDLASTIFRDFETDGVPASGTHKPQKAKIREWGAYLESRQTGSGMLYGFSPVTTDADPGAGLFRMNNAAAASATTMFIDDMDAGGASAGDVIAGWDDSTNPVRGTITLRGIDGDGLARTYNVTGAVVAGSGYRKVTITHVGGNGEFEAGAQYLLSFARAGNSGGGELTPYDFGAVGDGVADDATALDAWAQACIDLGRTGFCPPGIFKMSSGVAVAVTNSASFRLDAGAQFVAAVGFDGRLFQFDTSTAAVSGMVFEWVGGQYDGTNMANSDPGEANDVFDFFDNGAKCDHVKIHLDRVVTGDSWLDGGSDSHLFVAGSKSIDVSIAYSRGAVDAGIYISGNQSGANGKNLKLFINAERAAVAAIVKRLFETADVKVQALECLNGGAAGLADGDLGSGAVMVASGFHMNFDVMARRCENALNVQAVPSVIGRVNAYEMGIDIPGYTSAGAVGASISGSTKGFYEVNCHGVNPGCVVSTAWRAVICSRRLVEVTNYDATDNLVLINSSGFGVSFFEDANADRNRFVVKESGQVAASAVVGVQSSAIVSTPLAGWGTEINDNSVFIGGARNAEGLRVTKTANSVNFIHIFGAVTAGVPVIGFTGTDTDVPGVISTKGLGRMLLGGGVGLESLSIAKVASQVNAAEIVGAITASKPILRVRGADTDIGLTIRPKGTGAVDIADNAGNKRIEINQTGLGFFGTTPVAAKTGWAVPTGTFTRTTFVTGSVTLPQLAERVAALIQDLHQTAGYGVLRT